MTLLSTIKYGSTNEYSKPQISPSTKRKLESLGIDPTLVTSEAQAMSIIASRQNEKSFEQYAQAEKQADNTKKYSDSSTDAGLYSAMSLQASNTRYMLGL